MKVSELEGEDLDYWATKAEMYLVGQAPIQYMPSKLWADGGPIIEREKIQLERYEDSKVWAAYIDDYRKPILGSKDNYHTKSCGEGSTPLIAAMRCFVASVFGDDIDEKDS